jgi:hypothetical protein
MDSLAILRPCRDAGAVEQLLVDFVVGHHLRRIEHAQLHARGEEADDGGVDLALFQIALLHGIEIGLVVVVVLDLEGEVDALVVHAAAQADGGGLGLGGVEVVAVVDVDDGAAVGDDVALEVPPAAQLS